MRSQDDMITWKHVIMKIPHLALKVPDIARGIAVSNTSQPNKPVGLGWTLERAAAKNPCGLAVAYENVRLTYHEFNQWANKIAHYLMSRGVKKGDVVAIAIENRPELLAAVAGVSKLGAIGAMLNTSQAGSVLAHSYNLVKPKAAIIGEEVARNFDEARDRLNISDPELVFWMADDDTTKNPGIAPHGFINLAHAILGAPAHNPDTTNQIFSDDPCFYIYTSGTTGLPKAGVFKHSRWMKSYGGFGMMTMGLKKDDVFYNTLPLYHATGLCVCWGAALAGCAGFAIRRKFSASNFWQDVLKFDATAFGYVGELCRYLVDQPPTPEDRQHRVKKIIGNGLRPNIWGPFKMRFGIDEIYELYSASDGNIGFVNALNFDNTVGFSPMRWSLVEYDKDNEKPARDKNGFLKKLGNGSTGLLISKIENKSPLDGYTDPEKTKSVILENVFEPNDRWFNTGDLMRSIGCGHLQFVDRLGDTYRWKGENVSTTEVENLACAHPQVAEAVAYGVEIPNTNGRAGMITITPNVQTELFQFSNFLIHLRNCMPAYAIPVFLRIKQTIETTGTFKYKKSDLKAEGFDIEKCKDPVFALLHGSGEYVSVTQDIRKKILNGDYRF